LLVATDIGMMSFERSECCFGELSFLFSAMSIKISNAEDKDSKIIKPIVFGVRDLIGTVY
jgi:hypothetical protein